MCLYEKKLFIALFSPPPLSHQSNRFDLLTTADQHAEKSLANQGLKTLLKL
jgi:hypothetical protein